MINTRVIDHIYSKKTIINLTTTSLRIIAMVTMFIDHFAFIIIRNGILYGYDDVTFRAAIATDVGKAWYGFYIICRMIGRVSFPLFCFLLVEGVLRSKNILKYFLRLLGLAIISEIPFNLMYSASFFDINHQNVVIGLLISALMLWGIQKTYKFPAIQTLFIAVATALTIITRCDYSYETIIITLIIYFCRTERMYRSVILAIVMFIFTINIGGNHLQLYGAGAISGLIIYFYNGKKGADIIDRKIYYLFYPVHILLLFGIVYLTYPR